jgi:hypothetical protein
MSLYGKFGKTSMRAPFEKRKIRPVAIGSFTAGDIDMVSQRQSIKCAVRHLASYYGAISINFAMRKAIRDKKFDYACMEDVIHRMITQLKKPKMQKANDRLEVII